MSNNRNVLITVLVVGIACLVIGVYSVATKSSPESVRLPQTAAESSKRVSVPANQMWVDTGVYLKAGQTFSVDAQGTWRWDTTPGHVCDGNGMGAWSGLLVSGAPLAGLVARVGNKSFFTGGRYVGNAPASGNLLLSLNDEPGSFIDNVGTLDVLVRIQ